MTTARATPTSAPGADDEHNADDDVPGAAHARFRLSQRQEIARHLIRIVAVRGFSAVNVTEVTRAAQISRKTFYKYFSSIEEALVYAQEVALSAMPTSKQPPTASASGFELFIATLQSLADAVEERPELVRFLSFFDFAVKSYIADDRVVDEYEAIRAIGFDDGLALLRRGQQDGSIARHLDANLVALASFNAVFGMVQRVVNIPSLAADPALARRVVQEEINRWAREIIPPHGARST